MAEPLPLPLDVRLMNATASLLFALAAIGCVFVTLGWALRHPLFSIQAIVVQGDLVHNNDVTLRANVTPHLVGNLFTVDLRAARAAFEAVPWVRRAVLWRDFPNRLRVSLQEHEAVAYWGADTDSRLVNRQGEVFEANAGDIEVDSLPRLIGPDAQSATVLDMLRVLQPLFGRLGLEPLELELSARGGWRVELDTGGRVELGRGGSEEVAARVKRFVETVTQVTARHERRVEAIESADLRHPDGYALRLRGVTTAVQVPAGKKP
jgi:cell division protein FtsQ